MTQQEKAKHLVSLHSLTILSKIGHKLPMDEVKEIAKAAALIAVDEILSDYKNYLMHENTEYKGLMYWQEVKKEIEAL
jgi:hypothetical protein